MNGWGGGTEGVNRLSDRQIRAFITATKASSKATTKKLSDDAGLFVMVNPRGSPVWRVRYGMSSSMEGNDGWKRVCFPVTDREEAHHS